MGLKIIIIILHKTLLLKHILKNYFVGLYMIIYEKRIIFDITYREMHELLARKDKHL